MTNKPENCSINIDCYIPWKTHIPKRVIIPSNSRPIPQPRVWRAPARPLPLCDGGICDDNNVSIGINDINHQDYVSGAGFIRRRSIQNASKNAEGIWYRAAPNPIKHWRKQLFPRQGDLSGSEWNVPSERVSIRDMMERPGGLNTLEEKYNNNIWKACNGTMPPNILTMPLYINSNLSNTSCITLNDECNKKKIIKQKVLFGKDYHSSSKSYLQSRVKLYRQKEAIQFNRNKNIIKQIPKSNMYESLYKTEKTGCFTAIDCNCVIQVVYKPSNIIFAQNTSVDSSLYTKHITRETITQNQYNITNKWGLDATTGLKKYPKLQYRTKQYRKRAGNGNGTGSLVTCCFE